MRFSWWPPVFSRRRLAAALVAVLVLVSGVVIVDRVRDARATGQLSASDEKSLEASARLIGDWCLARQRPAGGERFVRGAVAEMVRFAERHPRRRTSVEESAYVTVRQWVTTLARSMNGACRRPVPDGDRLRVEALALAAAREGPARGALTVAEVRKKLGRVADVVDLRRTGGPTGLTTLRGTVRRNGDRPLRIAVVLGREAARMTRLYPLALIPGVSNKTVEHPVDGIDTAVVLDTKGLVGAPYTVNTGLPRSARRPAQRRGDLSNAVEEALVGPVAH